MRDAGCSADELWQAACPLQTLRFLGFTVKDLRTSGFDLHQIRDAGFGKMEMIYAGFSKDDFEHTILITEDGYEVLTGPCIDYRGMNGEQVAY
eukprot:s1373_g10.t1